MRRYYLLFALFLVGFGASGQQLKNPSEFLSYELGTRFTRHHQVVEYYRYVAGTLGNVSVQQYGETYEHRPLLLATVTSEANFSRLEEIRTDNLKRTGLMEGEPVGAPVAIVWLSYNVHGNESVSMEASMQTLYELADPGNRATQEWLKNTVVILDPCVNPDGRDRYANYYNQYGNRMFDPDRNSKEHNEVWPGGRGNHYLFDLNRDWAWMKQTESRSRIKAYSNWMPHVHVDYHEQGVNSPYYFAPAAEPYHDMVTGWQREFQGIVGKNNAKHFDNNQWLYFTKEVFDLLYPSYGDTYPTFNGAVGMTYEQGGGGSAGLGIITEFGDTLSLKDRIAHHHTSGLSTVEAASAHADRLVSEFQNYFETASPRAGYKTYLVRGTNDPDKLEQMMDFLDGHQVRYGHPVPGKKPTNGFNYASSANSTLTVTGNDIVIHVDQPKSTLVSVLFEPQTKLRDSITYDITAWAIPYSMGLDVYALKELVSIDRPVEKRERVYTDPGEAPYAYVAAWRSIEDAKFLAAIQQQGVKVRSSNRSFTISGKVFPRGSLIITRRNNEGLGSDLHKIVTRAAERFDRELTVTSTGLVESGYDFGSGNVSYIKAPRVAVLAGERVNSTDFGQVWYYFEREIEYPVTVLDSDDLGRTDLGEYDVLILPGNSVSLGEDRLKSIGDWVSAGGRLIAISGALRAFADKDGWGLSRYNTEAEKKEEEKSESRPDMTRYEDQDRESIKESIPGAIYRVKMDDSHPLAWGYGPMYHSLKTGGTRYAYLTRGWNVGVLGKGARPVSGFAGVNANEGQSESLVFGIYAKGRGNVVYMVDNPLFRSFWENGKLLFANAVFMVGQ